MGRTTILGSAAPLSVPPMRPRKLPDALYEYLRTSPLSPGARWVLLSMVRWVVRHQEIRGITQRDIAAMLGLTRDLFQSAMDEMLAHGLVSVISTNWGNVYKLHVPPWGLPVEPAEPAT